ncbi:MAG: hypothetical protein H7Z42_19060, partial [Roseiflexaceae bacterium]|nr:hypothetical protein [Roseiflexaceae bacterium]
RAGPAAPLAWREFTATFLQNSIPEGLTHQIFLADGTHLAVEVEANTIKPLFTNLPVLGDSALLAPAITLAHHTSRILGLWPGAHADTLVLYGFAGEVGQAEFNTQHATLDIQRDSSLNVEVDLRGSVALLRYWLTDRPTVVRLAAGGRVLNVVLLTTERAERLWPLADGSFVCGPDLLAEDAATRRVSERGLAPTYLFEPDAQQLQVRIERTQATRELALAWTTHAVEEVFTNEGWQELAQPRSLDELGTVYGYGWYRGLFETERATTLALVAPQINDRARVVLDGVDVGWLGVHPHGPQLAIELALAPGPHDLRLLADNLGRFNYGSGTGEQKGLLDTLYIGRQHDITGGWSALWQEAVFAGEAVANAKPWAVRADATDVRLDSFAFQGPSVWLLRAFEATAGRRYVLHLTGDRSSGGLFVNGANVARFSRHYKGGFIKADISELVHPGTNVIALNIQNYAGVAYRAQLVEYDPTQPLQARWSFRPGVSAADVHPQPSALSPQPWRGPRFFRASFAYSPEQHGRGPFRLHPHGLRKGQIWLNGRNVGRYWQIGPQESYKLPAAWLQAENQLLVFEEEGGSVGEVRIGG